MSAHGYRIIEKMASGSFGDVFKVVRQRDGAMFVMKRIPLLGLSSKQRHEAAQEIFLMSEVRHPFIVAQRDAFLFNENDLCIVMDFYDGGDMDALLIAQRERDEYFTLEQAMLWFVQMLLAVYYLHEHGIVHRDIKTHNIFIDAKNNSLAVGDFGIAERIDRTDSGSNRHSRSSSATATSQGNRARPMSLPTLAALPAKPEDASLHSALTVTSLQHPPTQHNSDSNTHNNCTHNSYGTSSGKENAPLSLHAAAESERKSQTSLDGSNGAAHVALQVQSDSLVISPTIISSIHSPTKEQPEKKQQQQQQQHGHVAEEESLSPYHGPVTLSPVTRPKAHHPIRGTPMYMSPEQLQGNASGQKADVWSLGCILYELLALRHPFEARDMAALIIRVIHGERQPLPGHYPPVIVDLVDSLLQVDVARRPTCAGVLQMPCVRAYLTVLVRSRVPTTAMSERSLRAQLAALHCSRHSPLAIQPYPCNQSQSNPSLLRQQSMGEPAQVASCSPSQRRGSVRTVPQQMAQLHEYPGKVERGARRMSVGVPASIASGRRASSVGISLSSTHNNSAGSGVGSSNIHNSNSNQSNAGRHSSFRRSSLNPLSSAAAAVGQVQQQQQQPSTAQLAGDYNSTSSDGESEGGGLLSAAMIEREVHTPPHAPSVERARVARRLSVADQEAMLLLVQGDETELTHGETKRKGALVEIVKSPVDRGVLRENACMDVRAHECVTTAVAHAEDDAENDDALYRCVNEQQRQQQWDGTSTTADTGMGGVPSLLSLPSGDTSSAVLWRNLTAHSAQPLMEQYGYANSTFFGDAPYIMDEALTRPAEQRVSRGGGGDLSAGNVGSRVDSPLSDAGVFLHEKQSMNVPDCNSATKVRVYLLHDSEDESSAAGHEVAIPARYSHGDNDRTCCQNEDARLPSKHLFSDGTATSVKTLPRMRSRSSSSSSGGGGRNRDGVEMRAKQQQIMHSHNAECSVNNDKVEQESEHCYHVRNNTKAGSDDKNGNPSPVCRAGNAINALDDRHGVRRTHAIDSTISNHDDNVERDETTTDVGHLLDGMLARVACNNVADVKDAPLGVIRSTVMDMRATLQEMTCQQQLKLQQQINATALLKRSVEARSDETEHDHITISHPASSRPSQSFSSLISSRSSNDAQTNSRIARDAVTVTLAYAQRRHALWREVLSELSTKTAEAVLAYYRTHSLLQRDVRVVQELVPQRSHWRVLPLIADLVVLDRLVQQGVEE